MKCPWCGAEVSVSDQISGNCSYCGSKLEDEDDIPKTKAEAAYKIEKMRIDYQREKDIREAEAKKKDSMDFEEKLKELFEDSKERKRNKRIRKALMIICVIAFFVTWSIWPLVALFIVWKWVFKDE